MEQKPINDFLKEVAAELGTSQAEAKRTVYTIFELIEKTLVDKQNLSIRNFGTFKIGSREATRIKNPQTLQMIDVPKKTVTRFHPCAALKEKVDS